MAQNEKESKGLPTKDSVRKTDEDTIVKDGKVAPIYHAGDPSTLSGHDITEDAPTKESVMDPEDMIEEAEGKVAPIDNAGTVELPIKDSDLKRFAKREGDEEYEGQKVEGFDAATTETGQKTKAHKTKAGL